MDEFCIDCSLPPELAETAFERAVMENPANGALPAFDVGNPAPLALETRKLWKPGRTLRLYFLDGDPTLRARVFQAAKGWEPHANIKFAVTDDPSAEIRISFRQPGSWSYIGTDALAITQGQPTMNYGWLNLQSTAAEIRRVVLHETGHALGAIHEHQNPAGGIEWDVEAVYRAYGGPPNHWDRQTINQNVLQRYAADQTQFTRTDPTSIMMYPVPGQLTRNGFSAGLNSDLSSSDKEFIRSLYPFPDSPVNPIKPVNPTNPGGDSVTREVVKLVVRVTITTLQKAATGTRSPIDDWLVKMFLADREEWLVDQIMAVIGNKLTFSDADIDAAVVQVHAAMAAGV